MKIHILLLSLGVCCYALADMAVHTLVRHYYPVRQNGECLAETDTQVLGAALADFAVHEDERHWRRPIKSLRMVVDEHAIGPAGELADEHIRDETVSEGWSVPPVLLDHLRSRNHSRSPVAHLLPDELCIKTDFSQLAGGPEFWNDLQRKIPGADYYLTCWLPGYSPGHGLAVVRFRFGPSAHGAAATFLLGRQDKQWRVLRRVFVYYA